MTSPAFVKAWPCCFGDVVAQLPADTEVTCSDDGTFVVLRAKMPKGTVPSLTHRGGDLRVVTTDDSCEVELRLCRDGRPDASKPVVAIGDSWPSCDSFAIDCDGTNVEADTFSNWLADVEKRNARGGRICLINVPEHLESITSVWESTHDMPMRERVGPRLLAELAELWS